MNNIRSTLTPWTHHNQLLGVQLVEISVSNLATQLRSDPAFRVLDVSEQHPSASVPTQLPHSVSIDWEATFSATPDICPSPLVLASAMSQLGLGDEHTIIVHDEGSGIRARPVCRWLRRFGHSSTLVLRGGRAEWVAQGFMLVREPVSRKVSSFTVRLDRPNEARRRAA